MWHIKLLYGQSPEWHLNYGGASITESKTTRISTKAIDKFKILGVLFGVVGRGGKRTKEQYHEFLGDIFGGAIQKFDKLLLLTSTKILWVLHHPHLVYGLEYLNKDCFSQTE